MINVNVTKHFQITNKIQRISACIKLYFYSVMCIYCISKVLLHTFNNLSIECYEILTLTILGVMDTRNSVKLNLYLPPSHTIYPSLANLVLENL